MLTPFSIFFAAEFLNLTTLLISRVAGDGDLPAWCSSSSSCVWHTDYSIVGCCAMKSDNCAIYTDCIDINSPKPDHDKSDVYTW